MSAKVAVHTEFRIGVVDRVCSARTMVDPTGDIENACAQRIPSTPVKPRSAVVA